MIGSKTNTNFNIALLCLGGFFGGVANGLLGAGGGIIMTFVLEKIMENSEAEKRDVFANVIAAILPISLVTVATYGAKGQLQGDSFGIFAIPAVIGGLVGAILLSKINTILLKRMFALLVIWSGIYMMLK